ncbi:hypothetical protein RRG08_006551 [Elysia crispata]|uniref:Sulfotransferase domain-containing protein n=1 Tax=Elysia crispata TaxID=231223 RepID=A0AAE1ATG4_9GAST|nr:hypothetical protein RRG08_006551 [Elysia crispata]
MSSGHQRLDPKQASRRRKLTLATYLSGAIGAILLSAIGVRYYRQVKRRATGIEDIKLEEYSFGRRAWLYKYRGFVFPNLFLDKIRNIHTFDVREDDVWVITFPKSGTTWVQEIVYLLMNDLDTEKALKLNIDIRFPYFEFVEPGLQAIAEMPSPRLIKSHLPFSILPNQMKNKRPKIIYIVRNPKDIVVSYYSFAIKFLKMVPFNGSFEDYCQLFVSDKVDYGPWWKHVSEAWNRRDDDNVLFLVYEDLHLDTGKHVREIANFLGKPVSDEQVDMIVKHCSFESMKQNNSVNYEWMKDAGIANKEVQFMRQGKVGDWKNHLSTEIVRQLDDMVTTKLPPDLSEQIKDSLPED